MRYFETIVLNSFLNFVFEMTDFVSVIQLIYLLSNKIQNILKPFVYNMGLLFSKQ